MPKPKKPKKPQKPREQMMAVCGGKDEPFIRGRCSADSCHLVQYDFGEATTDLDQICITSSAHAEEVIDYLARWVVWRKERGT